MRFTIFVVNSFVVLGSLITPNLPDKLRQYQMVTGISETELLTIYENHLSGKHDQSFPKFRLTGTAPSSDVHPVQFQTELLNVESVINAGVFLCMEPGYYHFSAAMSAGGLEWIGVEVIHNGRVSIFASGEKHQSAYVESTLKLELFDMVDIKKTGEAAGYAPKNFFEGWMLP